MSGVPSWAAFAVIASIFWALSNVIDKVVLTRWLRNPLVPVLLSLPVSALALLVVWWFHGNPALSPLQWVLSLLAGAAIGGIYVCYYRAAALEEISRVVALWYLSPLLVAVFAALFLGESFTPLRYVGVILLVLGAAAISVPSLRMVSFGAAGRLIALGILIDAVYVVLVKSLLSSLEVWSVFLATRFFSVLLLSPLLLVHRAELGSLFHRRSLKPVALVFLAESFTVGAFLFSLMAFSSGFATLANALTSLQALFVFLLATGASFFFPHLLKEELSPRVLFLKLFAILSLLAGVVFVSFE